MELEGAFGPLNRTAHDLLEETRITMEEIAAKLIFLKKEGRSKSELRELVTQMSLLFINLRQVNRSILVEEDRAKAETESAKAPVDGTTLQLHNLMYEKNHYLKAIKACKDFKSKYPDIELVPEEEFFRDAPADIKGKVMSADGAQDLMLKRLNYELLQRKELCKHREKLEQHKKDLLETIATRKRFLSSLPSYLKSLKKASLPVQQQLGMLHTKKMKQLRAAELLPPPLYMVYTQLLSQKEAFGEKIEMEIIGSMKDAQTYALKQSSISHGMPANMESNKTEDDTPDDEEDRQRRRKRPKKLAGKDNSEPGGIYHSHPLNVIVHIYDDENSDSNMKLLTLRFEYMVKLNVVCVGIDGDDKGPESNILCNLFPDDSGTRLPCQVAVLCAGEDKSFDEKRTLRPYRWAQHLAGMDFLPELSPLLTCNESSKNEKLKSSGILSGLSLYRHQNRVGTFLQRIRSRKKAQIALLCQLDFLTKLKWPTLTYGSVPWAVHIPRCILEHCSLLQLTNDQSSVLSASQTDQPTDSMKVATEGKSRALRDEIESTREDGELPSATVAPNVPDLNLTPTKASTDFQHSRSLALISKNITPSNSFSSRKQDDDLELILYSDSDTEQQYLDAEKEDKIIASLEFAGKPWEDHAIRELNLILSRADKEQTLKLQARIKISMEYPLRPPLFSLNLFENTPKTDLKLHEGHGLQWYNELRAMEMEVNLHVPKTLPLECENDTLSHQVRCLATLFDFQFDQLQTHPGAMKSSSVIDVGLCQPISGDIVVRSFRGRDRRKMFVWKDMDCAPGYP